MPDAFDCINDNTEMIDGFKNIHSVKDFFVVIKNYISGFSKCTDSVKEGK